MGEENKGLFLIKVEYDGELCFLGNIQDTSGKFTADKFVEGMETLSIIIDFNKIILPSFLHSAHYQNINKLLFLDLFKAVSTTLFNDNENKLNTGFGVINGEVNRLISCPEQYGKEPLLNVLFERVQSANVDWATFFYFSARENSKSQGIGLDILHPQQCYLLFVPIIPMTTASNAQGRDLSFCLDVTLTELLGQGAGVPTIGSDKTIESDHSVESDQITSENAKKRHSEQTVLQKLGELKGTISIYIKKYLSSVNNALVYKSLLPVLGALVLIAIFLMNDTTVVEPNTKSVTANSLRVRAEPSENSEIVSRLIRGQVVHVKDTHEGWSMINGDNVSGWVSSEYLVDEPNIK